MKKYRQRRGEAAIEVPDLPTKDQYDFAYKNHWGAGTYPSRRLGDISKERLWIEVNKIYSSKSLDDKKWVRKFLFDLGFTQ